MKRLRNLRKAKRYTQMQVEKLTGIDQSDYSKIETGQRNPSFEQCKKLALLFNTSMDYIGYITDEKEPYQRRQGTVLAFQAAMENNI